MSGGCLPLAQKLPLLPVIDVLRDMRRVWEGRLVDEVLAAAPDYVRSEVARLLPELGLSSPGTAFDDEGGPREGWRRERLFAAVRAVLEAATTMGRLVVVVEDLHWADRSSLDLLRFLIGTTHHARVPLVLTSRGDEPDMGPEAREWLAEVSALPGVAERHLVPLSMDESADQVTALAGARPSTRVLEGLFRRTQGNPFFTEQLVAAGAGRADGGDRADGADGHSTKADAAVPSGLGTLLRARTRRVSPIAGQVLVVLAVADRPVEETLIAAVAQLGPVAVEDALIELIEARLVAPDARRRYQPRHQLLAEVVAGGLLPARLGALHAAIADAMTGTQGVHPPAEIAAHYAAAGLHQQELTWTAVAAHAAEGVHAFPEAARHWQRVTQLWDTVADTPPDLTLGHAYIHAIDACHTGGDPLRANALAEEALARVDDRFGRAVLLNRASMARRPTSVEAALSAARESVTLFAELPASTGRTKALLQYGNLLDEAGRPDEALHLMREGVEIARQCGSQDSEAAAVGELALHDMLHGDPDQGLRRLTQAGELTQDSADLVTIATVATMQTDALLRTGDQDAAYVVGTDALQRVQALGGAQLRETKVLATNVGLALLELGETGRAGDLVDPMTRGEPTANDWPVHFLRGRVDVARGEMEAAEHRLDTVARMIPSFLHVHMEITQTRADGALWQGTAQAALDMIESLLPLVAAGSFHSRDAGLLLTLGMRACADLAELAHARGDRLALDEARAAGERLAARHRTFPHDPFRPHLLVATATATYATWLAETARLLATENAQLWHEAAVAWEELRRPHLAGYALWRQAEGHLANGKARTPCRSCDVQRSALMEWRPSRRDRIALARRARIDLRSQEPEPPRARMPYGLTERETEVLALLVEGKTNAQIGAALFMSHKTASVHVTHILQKLDVPGRVQAATLAERLGILHQRPPGDA